MHTKLFKQLIIQKHMCKFTIETVFVNTFAVAVENAN